MTKFVYPTKNCNVKNKTLGIFLFFIHFFSLPGLSANIFQYLLCLKYGAQNSSPASRCFASKQGKNKSNLSAPLNKCNPKFDLEFNILILLMDSSSFKYFRLFYVWETLKFHIRIENPKWLMQLSSESYEIFQLST